MFYQQKRGDYNNDMIDNPEILKSYGPVFSFSEGLAGIYLEGKWGYIDKSGQIVIEPQSFESISWFCGGLADFQEC